MVVMILKSWGQSYYRSWVLGIGIDEKYGNAWKYICRYGMEQWLRRLRTNTL